MRKNSVKNIRINGEVQKALSEIIRSELKDPRVHPMTSVVQVSVTPDLKICKAYISVLADEEQAKDTIRGLKSAGGLYQNPAGKKSKSSEHSADLLCAGPVYRVRCPYVETHR